MMTMEEKKDWISIYHRYLETFMKVGLASIDDRRLPSLELDIDVGCYYSSKRMVIHIGIGDAEVEDETMLMSWVMFRLRHEMQHVLSTTDKAWLYGIDGGVKAILEEYAKTNEPKPILFRKEEDYDKYIESLRSKGFYVSKDSLTQFTHFIANSLEDGRIERLCAIKNYNFRKLRTYWRGRDWLDEEIPQKMLDNLDDVRYRVMVILNQILTLATSNIYQKGFPNACAIDSTMHSYIHRFIPDITEAVKSGRCKKCMTHSINICKLMANDLMEAARTTPLEELLKDLIKELSKEASYSADSRTEEDGDDFEDEDMSPFGGMGLPSPEDESALEAKASGNEEGEESDEDSDDENGAGAGDSTDEDSNQEGADASDNDEQSDQKDHSGNSTRSRSIMGDNTRGASNKKADKDLENEMRISIEAALAESMTETQIAIQSGAEMNSNLPTAEIVSGKPEARVRNIKEVDNSYEYDVNFTEDFRDYAPDRVMPPEIYSQGEALKKEIEKVFQNQKQPRLRGQKNGRLDAAHVYKIAMGQMDAFSRVQPVDEFDGCAYFLVDNSGSMGNGIHSKRYYASMACAVMEHAFANLMPLKINAFDAYGYDSVRHDVIKNWSEKIGRNGSYNWYSYHSSGYGNKDGYSIRVATQELLARSEKSKILIILSDGLPTDYKGNECPEADVHAAVKEARKAGIEVASIYFGPQYEDDVRIFHDMYETNDIVTNPENISTELAKVVKRFYFK